MTLKARIVAMTAMIAVLATALVAGPTRPEPAAAVDGSQFQAGNIISDGVFYNSGAMSEAQVQAFLNQRVPSCQSGYVCLKDYRENTTNETAKVEGCAAYTGRTGQSAASIIWSVATACRINPQSLIVLLEKEQGLVSDSTPASRQYRSATGYGCPDTADCDANYYGFFNQVYNAAWQFKKYQYNPGGRAYQAGRWNTILWHPNTACGTSQVYIQNQATAGLYLYTPYRPNAAALANLYGTGDACSSYGNRNFWRIFNDWFGSTLSGGNLVRSAERATVYLIVGTTKHPIGDIDTFAAYSPLGPLAYVGQSYLDGLPTGRALKRLVRDENGRLYYVDGGGKYYFDTCSRVADFGYQCADYVQLEPGQAALLANRANLTNTVQTSVGLYRIDDARRRQAVDAAALSAAGLTERTTALSPAAIAHLPHAAPIMRDAVYVRRGAGPEHGLWFSGSLAPVSASLHATGPLARRLGVRQLEPAAYDLAPKRGALPPLVDGADGVDYALTPTGRARIDRGTGLGAAMRVSDSVLAALPVDADAIRDPAALKSPASGRTWFVSGSTKRLFPGPEDRDAALRGMTVPRVITVSAPLLDALANGPAWMVPGRLVKSTSASAVHLADGPELHHVTSPTAMASLPAQAVRVLPDDVIASMRKGAAFSTWVQCGSASWLVNGGLRYAVGAEMAKRYGLASRSPLALETATCAAIPAATPSLTHVVRAPGATAVYAVQDGRKRHILSPSVLSAVAGGSPITPADASLFGMLPTMAPQVSADPAVVPQFLKLPDAPDVYLIDGSSLRLLPTMDDYRAAASTRDGRVWEVTTDTLSGFSMGPDWVRPGAVVRAIGGTRVHLVDSGGRLFYIGTMEIPRALGAPPVEEVSAATVASMTAAGSASTRLRCGTTDSIGLGGALYPVPAAIAAHYPGPYLPVSTATCGEAGTPTKALDRFLRGPTGTVYLIENGAKRHILSPSRLTSLGGSEAKIIDASEYSLAQFPTGSPIG